MKYLWVTFVFSLVVCFSSSYWIDVAILDEGLDAKLVPIKNRYRKYLIFRKRRRGMYYSRILIGVEMVGYIVHIIGFVTNLYCSFTLSKEALISIGEAWIIISCFFLGVLLAYGGYLTLKTKIVNHKK